MQGPGFAALALSLSILDHGTACSLFKNVEISMVYGVYTAARPAISAIAHFCLFLIARLSAVSDFVEISMGLRG